MFLFHAFSASLILLIFKCTRVTATTAVLNTTAVTSNSSSQLSNKAALYRQTSSSIRVAEYILQGIDISPANLTTISSTLDGLATSSQLSTASSVIHSTSPSNAISRSSSSYNVSTMTDAVEPSAAAPSAALLSKTNGTVANVTGSNASTVTYPAFNTTGKGLGSYTTTGSGGSAWLDCFTSSVSWFIASEAYFYTQVTLRSSFTTYNTTEYFTETYTDTNYPTGSLPTYKLCDGIPRVNATPTTVVSHHTDTNIFSITSPLPAYPPAPSCTMDAYGCDWLYYNTSFSNSSGQGPAWLADVCGLPPTLGGPCIVQGG